MVNPSESDVYAVIRDGIFQNDFLPGSCIKIQKVADSNRISQIPVREALFRLVAEELVEYERSRGFYVKQIKLAELIECYNLMLLLFCRTTKDIGKQKIILRKNNNYDYLEFLIDKSKKNLYSTKHVESTLDAIAKHFMSEPTCSIYLRLLAKTRSFRMAVLPYRTTSIELPCFLEEILHLIKNNHFFYARKLASAYFRERLNFIPDEYKLYNEIIMNE